MKRVPSAQTNSTINRERDGRASLRLLLLIVCGLTLGAGFLYAARQHFAAVDYGYRSEDLKRERARLLEEQNRLLLAREEISSPAKLEQAARSLGMQSVSSSQIGGGQQKSTPTAMQGRPHIVSALAVSPARLGVR